MGALWSCKEEVINVDCEEKFLLRDPVCAGMSLNWNDIKTICGAFPNGLRFQGGHTAL